MEAMQATGIDFTIFFYNPNIHPLKEYELRKNENIRFAEQFGIPSSMRIMIATIGSRAPRAWRMSRSAACAAPCASTCVSSAPPCTRMSTASPSSPARWGFRAGKTCSRSTTAARAAARYPGLIYWDYNWRKGGGSARMIEISKREQFYQQEYCGCAYSLRDSNRQRRDSGRPVIRLGVKYYGDEDGQA